MANKVQTAAEVEESKLARAAEVQLTKIDDLVKAATNAAMKPWKVAVRWLTGVVVALALGAGVSGYLYANQYSLTEQVQSQATAAQRQATSFQKAAIAGCEYQNTRAADDSGNWDFFLDILLKGNTNAYDLHEESVIKSHVAQVDAPRDCIKAYSGS
jgi:uncharacterized protein HemX